MPHSHSKRLLTFSNLCSKQKWVDYFSSFINSDLSWRLPLSIQCLIGLILAIGTYYIPESPRWCLDTNKEEEGMNILLDLHGEKKAKVEFLEIKEGVRRDKEGGERSYSEMWRKYKRRVLIAMSAQMFAQLVSDHYFATNV